MWSQYYAVDGNVVMILNTVLIETVKCRIDNYIWQLLYCTRTHGMIASIAQLMQQVTPRSVHTKFNITHFQDETFIKTFSILRNNTVS
jgi:hypothetical protein